MPIRSELEFNLHAKQLAGGISEQDDHLKFPGQVKSAINVDFRLDKGIVRRPGARYVKRVTGTTSGRNYRLHAIHRDASEQYLVLYGQSTLRVFDTAGTESTVTITTDAQTYLDANSATADDFRLCTIADYTFVVNSTVPVAMTMTDDYTITGEWETYTRLRSHTPTDGTYHRVIKDTDNFSAGYYQYDVDGGTFGTGTFAALTGATNADPTGIWDNAGTKYGFKIRQQRRTSDTGANNIAWTEATKILTAPSGIWSEYAWQPGDEVEIVNGTGLMAGKVYDTGTYAYEVVEKISSTQIRLASTVTAGGDQTDVRCRGIGTEHEVVYDPPTTPYATMFDVAGSLQQACDTAGAYDTLVEWVSTGFQAGYFVLTCRWRGANSKIVRVFAPSVGVTDLTAVGQPLTNSTAVYTTGVTPVAGIGRKRSVPVDERWVRVAAPNQDGGKFDPTSMPLKLTRDSAANFTLDVVDWTDRFSGNNTSNPAPRLFTSGKTISDVFYFKGRLGFVGGEYVAQSSTNDILNFFLHEAPTVNADDRVDIEVGGERVSNIQRAMPYRNVVSILTDGGEQFELSGGQSYSPETAAITKTTSNTSLDVDPISMGGLLMFLAGDGTKTQLVETFYDDGTAAVAGTDNTAHVSNLLPGACKSIKCHENSRRVFVIGRDAASIYVYRQFFSGLEKAQSAWTTWTMFSGVGGTNNIVDIEVVENSLYALLRTTSIYMLVRFPLAGVEDFDVPYNPHGDMIVAATGVHSAGTTTWTFPDTVSTSNCDTAVLSNGFVSPVPGTVVAITGSGTTFTASGDYSASTAYIMRSFTSSVGLARPYVRDQSGQPDTTTGLLLKRMIVSHMSPYKPYSVVMARVDSSTLTFSFSAQRHSLDNRWNVPAMGDMDRFALSITSSGIYPFVVSGIQYQCEPMENLR